MNSNLDTLGDQTVKSLKAICAELSIPVKSTQKKADIVASLTDFIVRARLAEELRQLDDAISQRFGIASGGSPPATEAAESAPSASEAPAEAPAEASGEAPDVSAS